MKYSPRPFELLLTRFIARQTKIIDGLINQFIFDAATKATRTNISGEGDFFFRDYPALSRQVDLLLSGLSKRLTKTIEAGSEWSWDLANAKNDNMLDKIVKSIGADRIPQTALDRWNQKNLPALQAFEERRIGGMSLSDKVWDYTKNMKGDLELALDLGIGQGRSADNLSRDIREYLQEPNRLYRRVRDEKGVLRLSQSASNYHPGQGVYRSSYKNARRLAATETNMAYRTADNARMEQMDFILGYEVHLSNNHTCLDSHGVPQPFYDICDELQGRYPKDFVFTGWHPLCRCYVTTILPDKDEMIKYLASMDENGNSSYHFDGEVTEMPKQFNDWVQDNAERIESAEERGKLPYFLRDNPDAWSIEPKNDIDKDIADALGMKKGEPMSYVEANMGSENPYWQKGVDNGYNNNCQTCTVTHELRRRGFDVSAMPNDKDSAYKTMRAEGVNFWHRYEKEDGSRVSWTWARRWKDDKGYKGLSQGRIREFLAETISDTGRYEVTCDWRGINAGHVWMAERTKDGKLFFFDPQTGQKDVFMDRYLKAAELKSFAVLRVDDKRIKSVMAKLMKKY